MVFVRREEIEPDFKVIGHFEKKSELGNGVKEVYSIYLHNSTLSAEARQVKMNSYTYSILTFTDNHTHRLTVEMEGITTDKNVNLERRSSSPERLYKNSMIPDKLFLIGNGILIAFYFVHLMPLL